MPDTAAPIEIPNRALFKAAEVCELLSLQPYVLRSWEAEFPGLGVPKAAGGPRVYRRSDVEQAMRIRHLLVVEGLTLAGARRRIEDDAETVELDVPVGPAGGGAIERATRERLATIRRGLQSILELLGSAGAASAFRLTTPEVVSDGGNSSDAGVRKKASGASVASGSGPAASHRRKRSA